MVNVLEEGTGLNRRWSKGSIIVIYCIGGRDRVEPEVIEGEYCYYFIEVCMNVCLWHPVYGCDYLWHPAYECGYLWYPVYEYDCLWYPNYECYYIWHLVYAYSCLWHLVNRLLWHPVYGCDCLVFLHAWTYSYIWILSRVVCDVICILGETITNCKLI